MSMVPLVRVDTVMSCTAAHLFGCHHRSCDLYMDQLAIFPGVYYKITGVVHGVMEQIMSSSST